jgi:6-phosphogluconolactonase
MAALPLRDFAVHLWLGDERDVSSTDEARNGRLVANCFSGAVWEPPPRLHLWAAGLSREAACETYAAELEAALGPSPAFDLVFLGLGADGHAASLFPGDPVLDEQTRLAAPSCAPNAPHGRLSLTYPAFADARRLRFLVRGTGKWAAVERLAAGDMSLPSARIGGTDRAILYLE